MRPQSPDTLPSTAAGPRTSEPLSAMKKTLMPGATLGMVGGGQLGRMFAIAAAQMGYRVVVLCDSDNAPAAQVATQVVVGAIDDPDVVKRFARQCDVITLEFENIPTDTIAGCAEFAPTYPSADVLRVAQDRWLEKSSLRDLGLPVTPFDQVGDADSVRRFAEHHGYPVIVKTARSGYDGKGQYRVESSQQADDVPWDTADQWIAERCIRFDKEVSILVARNVHGQTSTFPLFENDHVNHILDQTTCPASVGPAIESSAREIAMAVADGLDLIGLICIEFFLMGDSLMINEIAPRPHNSGHLSIEACGVSQFEQQVRAVCGLSLGNTGLVSGGAAMVNLLGDLWQDGDPAWDRVFGLEDSLAALGIRLHLYGKAGAKVGRKMGHLTAVADDVVAAVNAVREARERLRSS